MMKASLPPLRLLLCAALAAPWPVVPAYADDPPPESSDGGETEEYPPEYLLEEIAAQDAVNGSFGQAYAVIGDIFSGTDADAEKKKAALKDYLTNPDFGAQLPPGVDAAMIDGLMQDNSPASQRMLALLVTAAADEGTRQAIQSEFEAAKRDDPNLTMAQFLAALRQQQTSTPDGETSAIDRIIMRARTGQPPAPQGDGRQPGAGEPGSGFPSSGESREWGVAEIYGKVGDFNVYQHEGRTYAVNYAWVPDESGQMIPSVVVADITHPADIHAWDVPLHASVGQPVNFQLPSGNFTLEISPNGRDFGVAFKAGEQVIGQTTASALASDAIDDLRRYGTPTKVGDKTYITMGQGSRGRGAIVGVTAEQLRAAAQPGADPLRFQPKFVSVVVEMIDGRPVPKNQASLGQVDGQWYDFKMGEDGRYEAVIGLPPDQTPNAGAPPPGAWPTPAGWTLDAALNARLSDSVQNVRFYRITLPDQQLNNALFMIFDKDPQKQFRVPGDQLEFVSRGHFAGVAVGLPNAQDAAKTDYIDLRKPVSFDGGDVFAAGRIGTVKRGASGLETFENVRNREFLGELLREKRFTQEQIDAITANMARVVQGGATFSAHLFADGKIRVNNSQVWPTFEQGAGDTHIPDQAPTGPQSGQITTAEADAADATTTWTVAVGNRSNVSTSLVDIAHDTAKVKIFTAANGAHRVHYISALIARSSGGPRRGMIPVWSSNSSDRLQAYPGDSQIHLRDVATDAANLTWNVVYDPRHPRTHGAVSVHSGSPATSANFIGVVAYWGVTSSRAEELAKPQ